MQKPDNEIHNAADGSYQLTPSEPTAQGYQPGDDQERDDAQPCDPEDGAGGAPPAPAEAQPE